MHGIPLRYVGMSMGQVIKEVHSLERRHVSHLHIYNLKAWE